MPEALLMVSLLDPRGAKVCISDVLDTSKKVKEITENGGDVIGLPCDVTDSSSCHSMVEKVADRFGGIDILVNNAAMFVDLPRRTFLDIGSEEWNNVMAVNVRGSFNCSKAIVPELRRRGGGSIINISSRHTLSTKKVLRKKSNVRANKH